MRRGLALALVALVAAGCSASSAAPERASGASATTGATGATGATGTTTATGPSGATGSDDGLPDPEQRIPLAAGRLARVFAENHAAERDAISAWTSSGGSSSWPVADDVVLLTLYEQRIYRTLAARKDLARRVLRRLDGPFAREARTTVTAGRALYEHFSPVKHLPDFRIRAPEAADVLLSSFREGQERFGVGWQVLAAVMLVETRMGRVRSNSSAGAQGPMQFLPSTWDAYGLGGDIRDPHDAIIGAANYLDAMGAPEDYRAALYAYNPVKAYVTAVWSYAKVMMRDPNAYFAFYDWQVFVRTTHGDVRLSGPGWPV
jgi:transglycosylase-like protein with SLT domain